MVSKECARHVPPQTASNQKNSAMPRQAHRMQVYGAQKTESLDKAIRKRPQTTRMLNASDYARLLSGRRDYGECIQSADESPSRHVQEKTNPKNPDLVVVYVSLAPILAAGLGKSRQVEASRPRQQIVVHRLFAAGLGKSRLV